MPYARHLLLPLLASCLLGATAAGSAVAQKPSPATVPAVSPEAQAAAVTSDGAGGTLHVWEETRRGRTGVYAQRLSAAGVPQWPDTGVAVCLATGDQIEAVVAADGSGGAIVAWADDRGGYWHIYAQRLDATGVPRWGAGGAVVCTASLYQANPGITSDGAGGAVIAWQDWRSGITAYIYAQRVDAAGSAQWSPDGVAVSTASASSWHPALVGDGTGGAIVTWQDWRNGHYDVFARRVDGTGAVLWPAGGVTVCGAAGDQTTPVLVADSGGGAVIAWEDARGASHDIYAQHVAGDGARTWTADGVALCAAAGHQLGPSIAPDSADGAIVAWQDQRGGGNDIYAQRVTSAGTLAWLADGIAVCAAAQNQLNPTVAAHGAGRSVIAWEDYRSGLGKSDVYAQWLDAAGAPQWAPDGASLCAAGDHQNQPVAVSDGGGVVIAWEDSRAGDAEPDLYAQRVGAVGSLTWTADGAGVYVFPGAQIEPVCVPASSGGVILVWREKRGGEYDVCARGFSREGLLLWPTAVLCGAPGQQSSVVAIPDGSGGAIAAWADGRAGAADVDVYAQRVDADGALLWAAGGVRMDGPSGAQESPALVSDGAGGAIVAWQSAAGATRDVFAQRVTAAGAPAWGYSGQCLSPAAGDDTRVCLTADGAGGAFAAWENSLAPAKIFAQHVDAGGTALWAPGGQPVCAGPGALAWPALATDGAGGVFVVWSGACASQYGGGTYAQRFDAAGTALWPAGGFYVGAGRAEPAVVSDGLGGTLFTWEERERGCIEHCPSDIYAQRVDGFGELLWQTDGAPVCVLTANQYAPQLVADGTGGAILAWTDIRAGYSLPNFYLQSLDATGAPRWTANGVPVSTLARPRYAPSLAPDGAGGVFVAWQEKRDGYRWLVFWQLLDSQGVARSGEGDPIGGVVGVPGGPPRPGARLTLGNPRPNPTSGVFTVTLVLPAATPAALELLDVRGRRVAARSLAGFGVGQHSVRLGTGTRLAPGVYFVRLTQGAETVAGKVCVLE